MEVELTLFIVISKIQQTKKLIPLSLNKKSSARKLKIKIPKEYEKRVKYISSLDHLGKNNFDIICFNSSIQYLEDYKQKLNKIFKLNPLYVLITKTNFHMGEENYFTLEHFSSG